MSADLMALDRKWAGALSFSRALFLGAAPPARRRLKQCSLFLCGSQAKADTFMRGCAPSHECVPLK